MIKVLLLEDDELFALTLIDYLEDDGEFSIEHVSNGQLFLDLTFKNKYDVYLLDINVPLINGLDLLKELRNSGDLTPSIYLTSYKDKETLKEGFLSGADDYLIKPFDMDELILRINSILRRIDKKKLITIGGLDFDFDMMRVTKGDEEIKLSLKTFELFELFYQNNHKIVSKEMIIAKLWNINEEYSEGSIRVYVNAIKKLFVNENDFKITNLKNVGYKIEY
ncbi:MAG: response regulator transcription factor [Campylobacterales bacterium]|nr:response regulator transcription factor [Campylobacterales bacterium]